MLFHMKLQFIKLVPLELQIIINYKVTWSSNFNILDDHAWEALNAIVGGIPNYLKCFR